MMTDRETRNLRDRQAWLDRAIDRAGSRRPSYAVARKLCIVYDQGAMPTAGDHFFATHPVMLVGQECEGCTADVIVDESVTIYVDFLRNAPAVGDIAVAVAVGGRWVADKKGPGTIVEHRCATDCPIHSDTITLSWSGAPCNTLFGCNPPGVFESPYGPGSTTLTWDGIKSFISTPHVMPGTCCPNDLDNGFWLTAALSCEASSGRWLFTLENDGGTAFSSYATDADTFTCSPLLIAWRTGTYYLGTLTVTS